MTEIDLTTERALETLLRSYQHLADAAQLMEYNLKELTGGTDLPTAVFDPEASTFTITPGTTDIEVAARIVSLDARRFKYEQKRRWIRTAVDTLPNPEERLLIAYRYFDGMGMQDVADKMNRSRSHVFSVRKAALTKLYDLLGEYVST